MRSENITCKSKKSAKAILKSLSTLACAEWKISGLLMSRTDRQTNIAAYVG